MTALPYLLHDRYRALGEATERGHSCPAHGTQIVLVLIAKVNGAERTTLGRRTYTATGHGIWVTGKRLTIRSKCVCAAVKRSGNVDAAIKRVDVVLACAG